MLGIDDPWIVLSLVLTFLALVLCVWHGLRNWNAAPDEQVHEADDTIAGREPV
jgi:hypothetical protein